MYDFVVNKKSQENGDHEVHNATAGCSYMPSADNLIGLGQHPSCHGAVAKAKSKWPKHRINGCYYCCYACHTS